MAKVTGPLLSFSASGQIANAQVYGNWRGVQYVRQKVIPANPQTTGQIATRSVFAWLSDVWKFAGSAFQAPWTAAAKGNSYTDRNLLMKRNIPLLRGQTDVTAMIMSPGANGGLSAAAATATGSAGTITGDMTAPLLPNGWTVDHAEMVAILQQDPSTATDWTTYEANDNADPYAPALTGLAAGTYVVGMWFVYTKPDGSLAYGPSTMTTATVS